ncbi:hypothetical protein ZWY2020_048000 [Hordeum vulgare]|nr:hypothetical protein ZWY2020_048000 [Hordeum vulgare]
MDAASSLHFALVSNDSLLTLNLVPGLESPVVSSSNISGSFSAARKALLLVSTCLQDNPRPDTSNFPSGRPFGPPGSGVGCPPGVDPHSQRSYLPPPHVPDYHARNFSSTGAAPGPRFFVEQEIVGSTIRALQSETGASVKVIDPVADSDEASMDKSSSVPARLLVPAQHIGCLLGKVTGSFQSIQDALLHITGRIRDLIIPPKPHPSGGMPPYPPVGNPSHHQSRQAPSPPRGGMPPYPMHPFRPNPPMGPFDVADPRPPGPPPSHPMEHMGADRMPYPYGCEQGGPRPFVEQPSPRTWAPEAPATDAPRSMPDTVPAVDFRKGPVSSSENQVATPATTTTEVVIPCKYIGFVCGTNGSDLDEIKKISGCNYST